MERVARQIGPHRLVLDNGIHLEHPAEIENMQVEMTFVGGELVFARGR